MAARDGHSACFTTSVTNLGREADKLSCGSGFRALLDSRSVVGRYRGCTLAPLAIQPSQFAGRNDAGCYSVKHPCWCLCNQEIISYQRTLAPIPRQTMKSISSALVVVCGTAMLITASAVPSAWSREALWNFGCIVGALGLIGWALTMGVRPGRDNHRSDGERK